MVALRRAHDEPQVVGTSLHVTMGAADIQDVRFHRGSLGLRVARVVTAVPCERHGRITIAVPGYLSAGSIRGTGG